MVADFLETKAVNRGPIWFHEQKSNVSWDERTDWAHCGEIKYILPSNLNASISSSGMIDLPFCSLAVQKARQQNR